MRSCHKNCVRRALPRYVLRRTSLQIWTRPLGLAGVWGAMVEDWLDELLPDDADVICRERVHLLVS